MSVWHRIGRQLRRPQGIGGVLAGKVMRHVNDAPNRIAVEALRITDDDVVLELGFGPGHGVAMAAALAPAGKVYGVDLSPVMLSQASARNRSAIAEGRVELHLAPFDRLPFADRSIDKLLAVNVVYFWTDALAIFREIRRVVRPGGRLVMYATDAATMRDWPFAGSDTHRLFGEPDLRAEFRRAGFGATEFEIRPLRLPAGVRGLLATADVRN